MMRLGSPLGTALVCALATCAAVGRADAATIAVPAGGSLQSALNAAAPGDVITLAAGATYVGNFVLPVKPVTDPAAFITIRSAAGDAQLPPDGVRISPEFAALLPKIRSANTSPALRTAAGAHHWRLMFVEFQANQNGYGEIVSLGAGDSSQTQLSQVPYSLIFDRVYVHGDPMVGQKRGIALHSRDTTIVNSYIADIKTVGQDTQAIGGFNGPGNYLIENNYLEAATENFMLGGADPLIANLVTSNVTFRRNYVSKPLAWRDPIIAPPSGVTATAAVGGGSLGAGIYTYKVVARIPAGQGNMARSAPSAEAAATIPAGGVGGVRVSWTPVAGATEYYVWGRTAGAENLYWKSTSANFTDTGAAGTSGTPGSATKWSVKNLFELKNAQDVLVEENVFENCWVADQAGYPIVFTPRNQDGTAPWAVVQRVMFRNNLIQHTAGGVNILGRDNLQPSLLTNNLTVRDNVFHDTGSAWGSGTKVFLIGDGGDAIVIDHNTIATTASTIVSVYGGSVTSPTPVTNFRYTNNMSEHRTYGIFGNGMSSGLVSINAYFPGSTVTRNVLAGGSASRYPSGNYFPTVTAWQAEFVSYAGGDYHLRSTSIYKGVGTDGADLGADIDAVVSAAAMAVSGDNRIGTATAVQITTASLPNGTVNQPYSQQLTCSGGATGCAWALVTSTLPAGLTFDSASGTISGTPSRAETGSISVTAYDPSNSSNTASATFSVTVVAPVSVTTISSFTSSSTYPVTVGTPVTWTAIASNNLGPVEYQFWFYKKTAWVKAQDYGPANAYSWTPSPNDVGSPYSLQVWVRRVGSTAPYDAWRATVAFDVAAPPLTLTSSVDFPTPPGNQITWTAALGFSTTAPVEYKFQIIDVSTNATTVLRAYSPSNQAQWVPITTGRFIVQCLERQVGSSAAYEHLAATSPLDVSSTPLTLTSFSTPTAFPAVAGTPIRFTARVRGGMAGPIQYEFWLYSATKGWRNAQPYSSTETLTWTPTWSDLGDFAVQVWVRSNNSTASYDAYTGTNIFRVNQGTLQLTTATPFPVAVGTPVTWKSDVPDQTANMEYERWVYTEASGQWALAQSYSTQKAFTWTPLVAGSYRIQARARHVGSTAYEATATTELLAATSTPPLMVFLASDVLLPATAGATVTWTASATGGTAPLEYQFWRLDAGKWMLVQDYSAQNTYSWITTATNVGQHAVQARVRSIGSPSAYESQLTSGVFDIR